MDKYVNCSVQDSFVNQGLDTQREYLKKSKFYCQSMGIDVKHSTCVVESAGTLITSLSTLELRFQDLFNGTGTIDSQLELIERFRDEGRFWTIHLTHYDKCEKLVESHDLARKGLDLWMGLNERHLKYISDGLVKKKVHLIKLKMKKKTPNEDEDSNDEDGNGQGEKIVVPTYVKSGKGSLHFPSVPKLEPESIKTKIKVDLIQEK